MCKATTIGSVLIKKFEGCPRAALPLQRSLDISLSLLPLLLLMNWFCFGENRLLTKDSSCGPHELSKSSAVSTFILLSFDVLTDFLQLVVLSKDFLKKLVGALMNSGLSQLLIPGVTIALFLFRLTFSCLYLYLSQVGDCISSYTGKQSCSNFVQSFSISSDRIALVTL